MFNRPNSEVRRMAVMPRFFPFSPIDGQVDRMRTLYATEAALEIQRNGGVGMFAVQLEELVFARVYAIAIELSDGGLRFCAGINVTEEDDGLSFNGLVTSEPYRNLGLGTKVVAMARVGEFVRDPDASHYADVRMYPDGTINQGSYRALRACGFDVATHSAQALSNGTKDSHLAASAPDGKISKLRVRADASTIERAFRALRSR